MNDAAVDAAARVDVRRRLAAAVQALPEHNATTSRDYGRGYAHAIRDVLALLDPTEEP